MTQDAQLSGLTRSRKGFYAIALLAIIVFSALPTLAQFDTGTITGSVKDPSGAFVAHATITVTNEGTGIQKSYVTAQSGNFVASSLPYGTYVVETRASGFADSKSQPVVLNVGATVQVNLTLGVAAAQESVQVNGTSTTVDTSSSMSGTTLDTNQVANLPINGRDVSEFLEVAPGSVGSAGFFQGSVNGMENIFTGLNITLDGQSAMRGDINGFLDTEGQESARITRASVDSIQEIDYSNSGYTAETGHSLLIESNHKKAAFLREVSRALTLTDIDIQNVRAETLNRTFEVVTFRAVERFADTLPVAAKLLAPSGRLAVLISRAQVEQARVALPQLIWEEPVPVPKSEIRVLLVAGRI